MQCDAKSLFFGIQFYACMWNAWNKPKIEPVCFGPVYVIKIRVIFCVYRNSVVILVVTCWMSTHTLYLSTRLGSWNLWEKNPCNKPRAQRAVIPRHREGKGKTKPQSFRILVWKIQYKRPHLSPTKYALDRRKVDLDHSVIDNLKSSCVFSFFFFFFTTTTSNNEFVVAGLALYKPSCVSQHYHDDDSPSTR